MREPTPTPAETPTPTPRATPPPTPTPTPTGARPGTSRRNFLKGVGLTGLASSAPLLAACSGGSAGGASGGGDAARTIKIGFVSPRTGSVAAFGEADGYILGLVRTAFASGLVVGGRSYDVQVIAKDGQSKSMQSSQVANGLIYRDRVDLMLATSTPVTVNPVSDACEAAGTPCITTNTPWEAWYFGRGAKPGAPSPFRFTYHYSFGTAEFAKSFLSLWPQVPTNKKVGVMWPNDPDGNAIRASLGPILAEAGYTIVDPGAYTDGTNDFSAQIARFKDENCEIFSTFPIPPDFATFWLQAAQLGYQPKIAQIAKTGKFLSQVEALGQLGVGLASGVYWTPTWPYPSSSTGVSAKQLGDGYTRASGRLWNQSLGTTLSLFDVAVAALKAAGDPKDKAAVVKALSRLEVDTTVGHLAWGTGPVPNVVTTPQVGGQWVAAPATSPFSLDFVICENANDPKVPVAATLQPYGRSAVGT
jgi:branched-chain amino acid transport system substrate-binding protein